MGQAAFYAMGTTISLLLPQERLEQATEQVRTLFNEWEHTLSRFLPESELSRLNQRAGEPVAVSPLLYSVLTTSLVAAAASGGIYDPTLLHQLIAVGYDRTFAELPPIQPGVPRYHGPGGGWRGIRIDRDHKLVTLPRGVGLDFGGIAKGMAVDAALHKLSEIGIDTALVNAGGDLAVMGLPPDMHSWRIAVPGRDKHWTLPLLRGAMATSGIARRHWSREGRRYHHLLDPRTGTSTRSELWSITVAADQCQQAEVAAKVAFILGPEQGKAFLREHHLPALLASEDGSWEAVTLWPVHLMEEL